MQRLRFYRWLGLSFGETVDVDLEKLYCIHPHTWECWSYTDQQHIFDAHHVLNDTTRPSTPAPHIPSSQGSQGSCLFSL